jgi:NarL family two-component system response regulator LiaR
MDIVMPVMNGIEAIQMIRRKYPQIHIIALTSFADDNQLVQSALSAGATSFLFKNVSVPELVNAIRLAHQGTPVLSPEATRLLISARSQRSSQDFNLSEREMEVLQLLVTGLNNPEIAEKLGVSRSTIKFHVSSILGKLGATSRTEAVSIAHQHKLVTH